MPEANRKYNKQHIDRAVNLCDNILEYLIAVGTSFVDVGAELEAQGKGWPEEYLNIIEAIDALVEGQTVIKTTLIDLRNSF